MKATEFLSNYVTERMTKRDRAYRDVLERLELGVRRNEYAARALDQFCVEMGWCGTCDGNGEIERSPSGNGNDPRRERVPCPECVGPSPEDR